MKDGFQPTDTIYITFLHDLLDGDMTLRFPADEATAYATETEALAGMRAQFEEDGTASSMFKLVPVKGLRRHHKIVKTDKEPTP